MSLSSDEENPSNSVADIRLRFESLMAGTSALLSSNTTRIAENQSLYLDSSKAASSPSIPLVYAKRSSLPSSSPSLLSSSSSLSSSSIRPRTAATPPAPKPKPSHLSNVPPLSNKPVLNTNGPIFQSESTEFMGFNPSSSFTSDSTKYLDIPEVRVRPSPPLSRSQEPVSALENSTPDTKTAFLDETNNMERNAPSSSLLLDRDFTTTTSPPLPHVDIKQFLPPPPPARRTTMPLDAQQIGSSTQATVSASPVSITPENCSISTIRPALSQGIDKMPNLVIKQNSILPPPKRKVLIPQTLSIPPSSSAISSNEPAEMLRPSPMLPPPLPRRSCTSTSSNNITTDDNSEMSDVEDFGDTFGESFHPYPDSSQVNRRLPLYEGVVHEVPLKSNSEAKYLHIKNDMMVAYGSSTTKVMLISSGQVLWSHSHSETKVTAVGVIPCASGTHNENPTTLWMGTKDGDLWEIDILASGIKQKRNNIHFTQMVLILAHESTIWTLSDDGKLSVWGTAISSPESQLSLFSLSDTPKSFRVTSGFKAHIADSGLLYVCKNKLISVYQPSLDPTVAFNVATGIPANAYNPTTLNTNSITSPGVFVRSLSEFTCAATVSSSTDEIFFAHEDGMVSIFSKSKMVITENINVTGSRITSLCGVCNHLWIGLKNGVVVICDTFQQPWKILKEWRAHNSAVVAISCDYNRPTYNSDRAHISLPVATAGASDTSVLLWDGWLKADWIDADMLAHSEAFCNFRNIDVKVITWNSGAAKPTDLEEDCIDATFLEQSLPSSSPLPEIIIFGFQELVDLDKKSVTAKSMFHSKKTKSDNISTSSHISHQYKAWQDWLSTTLEHTLKGSRYRMVQSSNMVGLFTCLFIKETELPNLHDVTSLSVKTGLGGLHGNKGGLIVRLIIDDSSLCFINCHLAAGHSGSINRNNDVANILDIKFPQESDNTQNTHNKGIFVNGGDGTMVLDHESCFLSGDLNYRIGLHRNLAIQYIKRGEYDKLYEADQLANQLKKNANLRLRAFQEAPIKFAPTYKFDVGSDEYDTSEKRRVPAWCDRIFYKGTSGAIQPIEYKSHTVRVSDHRPVSGLFKVRIKTVNNERRTEAYKNCLDRWQIRFDEMTKVCM